MAGPTLLRRRKRRSAPPRREHQQGANAAQLPAYLSSQYNKDTDSNAAEQTASTGSMTSAAPDVQLSTRSEKVENLWLSGDKGVFFERLRNLGVSDPDVYLFVETSLSGDDLWLARNILNYGPESNWPLYLQVEREMKGWSTCGGESAVFDLLLAAGGSRAGDAQLDATLHNLFAPGSDELWLATILQDYGPEYSWPIHLQVEREMKGWSDSGGKGEVFELLRKANGDEASNMDLLFTLYQVFPPGSDDLWLAENLFDYGFEPNWPIHLQVEREMKGWSDSGGKGAVFDILRTANSTEADNKALTTTLKKVFAPGSDDLWLATNLQTYGPEANWPDYIRIQWEQVQGMRIVATAGNDIKYPWHDVIDPADPSHKLYDASAEGNKGYLNPDYWIRVGTIKFDIKPGKKASEAVEKIFEGPTRLECLSMARAIMYRTILKTLGAAEFDILFDHTNLNIRSDSKTLESIKPYQQSLTGITEANKESEIQRGDWVYFKNHPKYIYKHPGGPWQGENAICMGKNTAGENLYQGFGVSVMTEDKMLATLIKAYDHDRTEKERRALAGYINYRHPGTFVTVPTDAELDRQISSLNDSKLTPYHTSQFPDKTPISIPKLRLGSVKRVRVNIP